MRKVISVAFREGESVYLKAAPETVRIVSGYLVRQKSVTYGLARKTRRHGIRNARLQG